MQRRKALSLTLANGFLASGFLARGFLASGFLASGFAFGSPVKARAYTPDTASALVAEAAAAFEGILRSDLTGGARADAIARVFWHYYHFETFALRLLSETIRQTSAAQRRDFVAAYLHHTARQYARPVDLQAVSPYQITGTRPSSRPGDRFIQVTGGVQMRGDGFLPIDCIVTNIDGRAAISNVVVNGLSLWEHERQKVFAIWSQEGRDVARVIQHLRAH